MKQKKEYLLTVYLGEKDNPHAVNKTIKDIAKGYAEMIYKRRQLSIYGKVEVKKWNITTGKWE